MTDTAIARDPQKLSYIGAGVLAFGTFAPIVSMPIVGNLNYFANGRGDGVILVILAAVAAGLARFGMAKHVLWTGLGAAAMLLWAFIRFQNMKSEMQSRMDTELADNPFRGFAEMAMQSVQLQWGWFPLVAGAATLIYAGLLARKSEANSR